MLLKAFTIAFFTLLAISSLKAEISGEAVEEIQSLHPRWDRLYHLLSAGDSRNTVMKKLLPYGVLPWSGRVKEVECFDLDNEWILECSYVRPQMTLVRFRILPNKAQNR